MTDKTIPDSVSPASTPSSSPTVASRPKDRGPVKTSLPVVFWGTTGAVLQPSALPRYERLDLLGQGGMGEVTRARDNDIGREVAVKRLRPDLEHPEIFARFVEEVRTVGQLEHPNIVPIHDAGLDAQGYFFVMKKLEGETLGAIIHRLKAGDPATHQRWPMERRVDIIRKVLEAVHYAHSHGVVHRDIKPGNIQVGPMGEVFLLDWGIARRDRGGAPDASAVPRPDARPEPSFGSALSTDVGAVMGTPEYMSPEQAAGEVVDARSDLYSLCLTLYELATLHHPFAHLKDTEAVMKAVVADRIPHASSLGHPSQPAPPMDLGWLLKKGVAKSPRDRYQSAAELIRRFDDRAEGNVPIQCHVSATKRVGYEVVKFSGRHPLAWLIMLLGTLALVGALALLR